MSVFNFLQADVILTLRKWAAALRQLTFTDNFRARLIKNVEIPPGHIEIPIRHNLGAIPSYVLLVKHRGGVVENGNTADTSEIIYLINRASTTTAIVDVLIML